jgi:hypothetical protein
MAVRTRYRDALLIDTHPRIDAESGKSGAHKLEPIAIMGPGLNARAFIREWVGERRSK